MFLHTCVHVYTLTMWYNRSLEPFYTSRLNHSTHETTPHFCPSPWQLWFYFLFLWIWHFPLNTGLVPLELVYLIYHVFKVCPCHSLCSNSLPFKVENILLNVYFTSCLFSYLLMETNCFYLVTIVTNTARTRGNTAMSSRLHFQLFEICSQK